MHSLFRLLFLGHFLLSACLPKHDVGFLLQIPRIYQEFQIINGKTDFWDFLEDQFFAFEDIWESKEEDDDEEMPVKIQYEFQTMLYCVGKVMCCEPLRLYYLAQKQFQVFQENELAQNLQSVFHPPRMIVFE